MDNLMKDLKNNNEKFSEEYVTLMKEYYEKLSKGGVPNAGTARPDMPDEEGGLVITPIQGCVVKTSDSNGQKIFINVTSHDKIEEPKEEHILEMENRMGVRLPMSLSEKAEDFDNKNQICQVYDVIFNTNVLKKTESDPMAFQFMFEVVRERIRQRFNHELSQSFVKLKNLKYKGKHVRPQRVRVRVGPKIEEVIKEDNSQNIHLNSTNNPSAKEMSKIVNEKGKTPNWNLIVLKEKEISIENFKFLINSSEKFIDRKFTLENFLHNSNSNHLEDKDNFFSFYNGTNANPKHGQSIIYLIEMNLLSKSQGVNITISDEGLIMNCPKIYSLDINFPYRVNSKEAYSIFEPAKRYLYVILPFDEKDCEEFRNLNAAISGKTEAVNVNISDDYLFDVVV
jgi:hypothetical protein